MNSIFVWFGFLSVIIYLFMDTFAGRRKALWGVLFLGVAEAVYSIIQFGTFDYLSLISFLIMVVFVVTSLIKDDDFYFKIHGALINILLALIMLVAWYFLHKALLLDMAVKYLGLDKFEAMDPALDKDFVKGLFLVLSQQLPAWLILHALLTIYAAANWGKWIWAFIWGPGFIFMMVLASAFAQPR